MTEIKICPHGCGKEWVGSSNRRVKTPLDEDAKNVANNATWSNCSRLTNNADGTKRRLTMSKDDYFCRRVWMDAYLKALDKKGNKEAPEKKKDKQDSPKSQVDPKVPYQTCEKAILVVKVTDYEGKPIKDAIVNVIGLGKKRTDENGYADYGEVTPGTYDITAEKDNYSPAPGKPHGPAKKTENVPPCQTTVVYLQLDELPRKLRENIIIIGSEQQYDLFWLKMMFVAAAFYTATTQRNLRQADKNTIMFVDVGYTEIEKKRLEELKSRYQLNIISIKSTDRIISYFNERPKKKKEITLLQDVVFFSHGVPGMLRLNYSDKPNIDIDNRKLSSIKKDVFMPDGKIYSYACRTGNSSLRESFKNDDEADPKNSLAQKMADHFQVEVHAFLTRTNYGEILREKSDSQRIAETLKTAREKPKEKIYNKIIDIPPDHEGLPHPGLAKGGWFSRTDEEGTDEYALWRKKGGIRLPSAGETPKGLSKSMKRFTPRK